MLRQLQFSWRLTSKKCKLFNSASQILTFSCISIFSENNFNCERNWSSNFYNIFIWCTKKKTDQQKSESLENFS